MLPDFQKAVEKIIETIPGVQYIYVFGSFADFTIHPESDIDLAFYSNAVIEELLIWETAQEIAAIYNKDVDLIDLSKGGDVLKMEIISKGKVLYSNSEKERQIYESRIVEDYMDYKEWVLPIEREILKSGFVYK